MESQNIDQQYPDCATEGSGEFIPLYEQYIVGETVPKVEPWPVDFSVGIKMFICQPVRDKGKVAHAAAGIPPGNMEQLESQGHQGGVYNNCGKHTRWSGIP